MQRGPEGGPRGKLKAVARKWAGGRGGSDIPAGDPLTEAAADFIRGRDAQRLGGASDLPEIGPDEIDAVSLFYALTSQWRWHEMSGRRSGLDYHAVGATAVLLGIEMNPGLFADVQLMELEAMKVWAKK